jgi:hypothetical protein
MHAFKMKFLHSIEKVTKLDRIRNEVIRCSVNERDQKEKETGMVWPCKKNGRVQAAKKIPRNERN